MPRVLRTSESKFLERARTALTNARNQAEIKKLLADYGMNDSKLAAGKSVYTKAKQLCEKNVTERAESAIASNAFHTSYDDMLAMFRRHRNQVQIFFRKQPDLLLALGVTGRFPSKYSEVFDKIGHFYTAIKQDAALQKQTDKIKLNAAEVDRCLKMLDTLLAARSDFDKELGESQDATQSKNAALLELKDWMDDFDSLAKVALYDRPQLLESLGIFVRS